MLFVHVCDMELLYPEAAGGSNAFMLTSVAPANRSVTGETISGTVRWLKCTSCCGAAQSPDLYGLIQTNDGAPVMFSVSGSPITCEEGDGKHVFAASFEADDERYRWLNSAECILEGVFDSAYAVLHGRFFARIEEYS